MLLGPRQNEDTIDHGFNDVHGRGLASRQCSWKRFSDCNDQRPHVSKQREAKSDGDDVQVGGRGDSPQLSKVAEQQSESFVPVSHVRGTRALESERCVRASSCVDRRLTHKHGAGMIHEQQAEKVNNISKRGKNSFH